MVVKLAPERIIRESLQYSQFRFAEVYTFIGHLVFY